MLRLLQAAFVDEFLKEVTKHYEIVLYPLELPHLLNMFSLVLRFTASLPKYADPLLDVRTHAFAYLKNVPLSFPRDEPEAHLING